MTPNNEKTILVAKCGCADCNKAKAIQMMASYEQYINNKFNDTKYKDDTLVVIVIPSNVWDIEIYNPKSDEITKEYIAEILNEYQHNEEDIE